MGGSMKIRNVVSEDFFLLREVVNEWTFGGAVQQLVPRFYFEHFQSTSFIVNTPNDTAGIVISFVSQSNPKQLYIHFISVNPDFRKQGVGRLLYSYVFKAAKAHGCEMVSCVTKPINRASIAFHEALGFQSAKIENYYGEGEHRIVFKRSLLENQISR